MTEVLTTCSIMTNCALVGFVSHGILFYFPDISPNQRVTKLSPASFTTHTLSPASLYIRNLEGGGSTVLGASRPPPPPPPSPLTHSSHSLRTGLASGSVKCLSNVVLRRPSPAPRGFVSPSSFASYVGFAAQGRWLGSGFVECVGPLQYVGFAAQQLAPFLSHRHDWLGGWGVTQIWITILCEHCLLLFKVRETCLLPPTVDVRARQEHKCCSADRRARAKARALSISIGERAPRHAHYQYFRLRALGPCRRHRSFARLGTVKATWGGRCWSRLRRFRVCCHQGLLSRSVKAP